MFKKIQTYFANRKTEKNIKEYYRLLARGGLFLKFIYDDLEKMKNESGNREKRRNFEKEISRKGKFTPEIIEHYAKKVDYILEQIEIKEEKQKWSKQLSKLTKMFMSFRTTKSSNAELKK